MERRKCSRGRVAKARARAAPGRGARKGAAREVCPAGKVRLAAACFRPAASVVASAVSFHVLLAEDNADDVFLMQQAFRKAAGIIAGLDPDEVAVRARNGRLKSMKLTVKPGPPISPSTESVTPNSALMEGMRMEKRCRSA